MKRFIYITLLFLSFSSVSAEEKNMAILKTQYTAWKNYHGENHENPRRNENKYILQIGEGSSYYYDPQSYYVDSINNDPTGRAILQQATRDAFMQTIENGKNPFEILKAKGLMSGSSYKCRKNFASQLITVWDWSGDLYQYDVDMNDLSWELLDSTTTILDYECNLATADYHGRKWKAWFTTDIPVNDGPWQLCGLPGLIMKAETDDGDYGFEIIGIQKCNEPFKPTLVNPDKVFKTKRITFLKMSDYSRRNRSARISAMTNRAVNVKADYKGNFDFIETDYR